MPIHFTFLLLFSWISLLWSEDSTEKIHFSFEVLQVKSNYRNVLQKRADELSEKGFVCRIVPLKDMLSLRCNDIKDFDNLAPTIKKFKKENIVYTLVNLDKFPKKNRVGRQIPLYIGYRAYEQKEYKKAYDIFHANYREKKSSKNAKAYALVLIKQGSYREAIAVLAPYGDDPRMAEVYQDSIVTYVDQLIEKSDFTEAKEVIKKSRLSLDQRLILDDKLTYMAALELNRKKEYAASSKLILSKGTNNPKEKELLFGNLMALAAKALKSKDYAEALTILKPYRSESKEIALFLQKILYYSSLDEGWKNLDKDPKKALNHFKKCEEIESSIVCREGQMYSYHRLHDSDRAILAASELYMRKPEDKYLKILIENYLLENNSNRAVEYYQLLKNKQGVQNPQYAQTTALVYRYIKAGDLQKAKEMIGKIEDPKVKSKLYTQVTRMQKSRAMNKLIGYSEKKEYDQCYAYAQKLHLKYNDINIDRIGGWCAYNDSRYEVAQAFFEHTVNCEHEQKVDDLYALALSAHKSDNDKRADEVLRQATQLYGYTGKIASLYSDMGEFRRAKEILVETEESLERDMQLRAINKMIKYPTSVTQLAGGLFYYRNKGTEGKEYLEVVSLPIDIEYLSPDGYRLYGEFDLLRLSNGTLGSADYRAFGFGQAEPYYINSVNSFEGNIGFRSEAVHLEIGSTPIGLNLSPQWTGKLFSHYRWGKWDFHGALEQQGIKQSFLSYAGQSTKLDGEKYDWGRVLKQGATVGLAHDGDTTYTLDLFYYPRIYGENIVENSEAKAVVTAIHHTATVDYAFLDFGALIVYDTFDTNSNLFTYGHGGYFSPQSFWLGSMVVDIGDYIGENTYYRFQGALGYQTFTVDDTERFPLESNYLYPSIEEGYNESGVTIKTSLQLGYAITDHLNLSAGVSWEKIYGYDLLQIGVSISYYFNNHKRASLKRLRDTHRIDQLIP